MKTVLATSDFFFFGAFIPESDKLATEKSSGNRASVIGISSRASGSTNTVGGKLASSIGGASSTVSAIVVLFY
jgi:hypothetical protein